MSALAFLLLSASSAPFFPTVSGDTVPVETPQLLLKGTISLSVGSDGRVTRAWVRRSTGIARLDTEALRSARAAVYEPARLFGRSVSGSDALLFRFASVSRFPQALIAPPDTPPGPRLVLFGSRPRPLRVPSILCHVGRVLVMPSLDSKRVVRGARLRQSSGCSLLDSLAVACAAGDSWFFVRESSRCWPDRPLLDFHFTLASDGVARAPAGGQ